MIPDATIERLFAILEEIQNSTDKLRDVITDADTRRSDIARQDADDKKKKLIN
jgi:hypothetical protein